MAEIEFKRRGTPVWVVILALAAVGIAIWLYIARRDTTDAPVPAGPGSGVTLPPAQPAAADTAAAPAPATTPLADYATFLDSRPAPAAGAAAGYVADALTRLAAAVESRFPNTGVQLVLIRAAADTLRLPNVTSDKQTEVAQAALFAAAYALGRGGPGEGVNVAATQVRLGRPLGAQLRAVRAVLDSARSALENPALTGGAPAPKS